MNFLNDDDKLIKIVVISNIVNVFFVTLYLVSVLIGD